MPDIKIVVADTFSKRLRGWLGWDVIPVNTWLWLTPCSGVHTLLMRETLTLVYLDKRHEVCEIVPEIRPWRFHTCSIAHSVLESSHLRSDALYRIIPLLPQAVRRVVKTQRR